jgi:hypothetical protein
VRRRSDTGYIIAGANPLARALAVALRSCGEDVVLIDWDRTQVAAAERNGLAAVSGSVLDEQVLEQADIEGRHGVVGLIPNEAVTLLLGQKARREFRVPFAYLAVRPTRAEFARDQLHRIGARMLFGRPVGIEFWIRQLTTRRAELRVYAYAGVAEYPAVEYLRDSVPASSQPLLLVVARRGRPAPVDDQTRLRPDDLMFVLTPPGFSAPRELELIEVLRQE